VNKQERKREVSSKRRGKTNPVAKNMEKFNRPATYVDRKKREKKGYKKHKEEETER
jgi:hypothetical protein